MRVRVVVLVDGGVAGDVLGLALLSVSAAAAAKHLVEEAVELGRCRGHQRQKEDWEGDEEAHFGRLLVFVFACLAIDL